GLGELGRKAQRPVLGAVVDDQPALREVRLPGERVGEARKVLLLVANGSDDGVVHAAARSARGRKVESQISSMSTARRDWPGFDERPSRYSRARLDTARWSRNSAYRGDGPNRCSRAVAPRLPRNQCSTSRWKKLTFGRLRTSSGTSPRATRRSRYFVVSP